VPWCEECSKFQTPEALDDAGACPDCGAVIGEPHKVPWHFKLLVLAVIIYLGWRAWQGITWVIGRF
jgi:uncharacterized paraquat-inducible protein A